MGPPYPAWEAALHWWNLQLVKVMFPPNLLLPNISLSIKLISAGRNVFYQYEYMFLSSKSWLHVTTRALKLDGIS